MLRFVKIDAFRKRSRAVCHSNGGNLATLCSTEGCGVDWSLVFLGCDLDCFGELEECFGDGSARLDGDAAVLLASGDITDARRYLRFKISSGISIVKLSSLRIPVFDLLKSFVPMTTWRCSPVPELWLDSPSDSASLWIRL